MAKKLKEIWTSLKLCAVWAAEYFAGAWLLFWFIFRFDITSGADWASLPGAHLHGFPGLAFGVILIAALPIFIATTLMIWRSGKPLLESPWGKKKKPEEKAAAPTEAQEVQETIVLPDNLPAELRAPYISMKRGGLAAVALNKFIPPATHADDQFAGSAPLDPGSGGIVARDAAAISAMPLPADFDEPAPSTTPVFKEISFGNSNASSRGAAPRAANPGPGGVGESASNPVDQAPDNAPAAHSRNDTGARLSEFGFATKADGEIVIATKQAELRLAIATHNEPDFWIADADDWFAPGKQKPSPIPNLLETAARYKATPVLYLSETNIMNLDSLVKEWQSGGIRVIRDLGEL
ncbi:MAG: hypothetical protein FWC61_00045 [Proteobacteria bacterium]|nr:hypothetical protein [Pseudomonadota bacterium]